MCVCVCVCVSKKNANVGKCMFVFLGFHVELLFVCVMFMLFLERTAPEVIMGIGHTKEVDWWSLGILLYELTVGIPPFYSQNTNEMYNKIKHGVLRFPQFLSEGCKQLIVAVRGRSVVWFVAVWCVFLLVASVHHFLLLFPTRTATSYVARSAGSACWCFAIHSIGHAYSYIANGLCTWFLHTVWVVLCGGPLFYNTAVAS